ncbi:hypothetical protein [Noviherbaspirillum pedocola]|uniref:Uncharacterized protein n=1 Tax=Noviherbaspirillum pedocola TaxID=2801341 RepID=A0A934ST54_9BURK|nr:hypothetical protein [Noviherbaspirillum pedocola]MBK4736125.1 hypothetical protein [Noviherbaspirillum pedocola]
MERKFEAVWKGSYVRPATEIVDLDFFDVDNNYDKDDIRRIRALTMNQSVVMDGGDHIVKRLE